MGRTLVITLMVVSVVAIAVRAEEMTALEIAQKAYHRYEGQDVEMEQTMILQKEGKSPRQRTLLIRRMTAENGDEKTLLRFLEPADVRGTGFLVWSYEDSDRDDDQWLYLPALKRVRRIAAQERSRSFMGTDFTYDDLGDRKPSEDEQKLLGEEKVNGRLCYVIEATPRQSGYQYSRRVGWIDKETFILLKGEFFDRKGELLKRFSADNVKTIDGIPTPLHLEMVNVQTDHSTVMEISNVRYNTGLGEELFTQQALRHP